MPPKSVTKKSLDSAHKCRRSRRIADRIKSMVKEQSASSKELPSSTKKRGKLPYRKKHVAKTQLASLKEEQPSSTKESEKPPDSNKFVAETQSTSSKEEQPSSTNENGKPSHTKKSVAKKQPASSKEGQPSSRKESELPPNIKKSGTKRQLASSNKEQSKSTAKRRRVVKTDKINERATKMGVKGLHDFSVNIKKILGELSPDLTISEEAIVDMNIYLKHVFERVAERCKNMLIERSGVCLTDVIIENAIFVYIVKGELAKFCMAEGRRAVKKWNEEG